MRNRFANQNASQPIMLFCFYAVFVVLTNIVYAERFKKKKKRKNGSRQPDRSARQPPQQPATDFEYTHRARCGSATALRRLLGARGRSRTHHRSRLRAARSTSTPGTGANTPHIGALGPNQTKSE